MSIALEILAEPRLLMLDEPTSGLDPGMDSEVMRMLRDMAARPRPDEPQRTVVVVTHSTDNLRLADRVLLLAPDGRPVFFGGARSIPDRFRQQNWAELMRALNENPTLTGTWVDAYREGPEAAEARRHADEARAAASATAAATPRGRRPRGRAWRSVRQFGVLFARQWALLLHRAPVLAAGNLREGVLGAFAVASPVTTALAGAAAAVAVTTDDPWTDPAAAPTAVNLLVTLAMLAGQALTYSDIVAEFDVIRREHRTGASTSAVVLAKWCAFAVLAVVQAAVITAVFVAVRGSPDTALVFDGLPELFVDLAALSVATMSLGLLISVVARKLEQAVALATGTAIAQVAFNGWTADLSSSPALNAVAASLPARWGFAATAASLDLRGVVPIAAPDLLWRHETGQWATDLRWLGGLTVAYTLAAILLLAHRLGSSRGPGRRLPDVMAFSRRARYRLRKSGHNGPESSPVPSRSAPQEAELKSM